MEHKCKAGEASLFIPETATLVRTEAMTPRDRFFEFKLDGKTLGHKPGQFAEISIPGFGEAPVSLSSSPTRGTGFEMVVRNVGRVTGALHKLKPGDRVGVRGPFGTAFPMETLKGRDLLFVGGGIGLVPMRSAIQYAFDHRKDYGRITILFGCTDPSQRLFTQELAEWKKREDVLFLETVDRADASWSGNVGVITTLFPSIKQNIIPDRTSAIIVGPPVMYKFVIVELLNTGFRTSDIIVSLERNMKCGVGKCGHCQINNLYVCQDGPVLTYDAIKPLVEAL
jgi:NAD(P)H-flavin reductase